MRGLYPCQCPCKCPAASRPGLATNYSEAKLPGCIGHVRIYDRLWLEAAIILSNPTGDRQCSKSGATLRKRWYARAAAWDCPRLAIATSILDYPPAARFIQTPKERLRRVPTATFFICRRSMVQNRVGTAFHLPTLLASVEAMFRGGTFGSHRSLVETSR